MTPPLLSALVFLPLAGALAAWLLPRRWAPGLAGLVMVLDLILAVAAVAAFDATTPGFQLQEKHLWIPGLGVSYQLGVDALSLFFLPVTALLFLAALAAAWKLGGETPGPQLGFLLLLQGATLGIFCALDTLLFFVFWELALVPLYFLLLRWGATAGAAAAAPRYFLIMLAGGVPLLFAFLFLAFSQATPTTDLIALLAAPLPRGTQQIVFVLLFLGFGVKVPLVPLHTWLPQFALAAPGYVTAIVVGLKLGIYGLLRWAIPLAPQAAQELHWLLAGAGTVAVLYGAVGMLSQTNLRAVLAFASVSHAGLAVLGLSALSSRGVQGVVALTLSFSLATGGGFLLLEFLRQRTGSTDLQSLGGAARSMPLLAGGFLLCGLVGMGLPGTAGFPGELLVILAALHHHAGSGLGALFGLTVGAAAFLTAYRKAFFGPVSRPEVAAAADLRPREWAVLVVIVVLALGFGLFPGPLLDALLPAAEAWAMRIPAP